MAPWLMIRKSHSQKVLREALRTRVRYRINLPSGKSVTSALAVVQINEGCARQRQALSPRAGQRGVCMHPLWMRVNRPPLSDNGGIFADFREWCGFAVLRKVVCGRLQCNWPYSRTSAYSGSGDIEFCTTTARIMASALAGIGLRRGIYTASPRRMVFPHAAPMPGCLAIPACQV